MVSVLGDVHLRDTREICSFRNFRHQHVGLALRMVDHHLVVFLRQLAAHRVKLRRAERLEKTVYILALWVDGFDRNYLLKQNICRTFASD